jgi:hypothetical protein
MEKTAPLDFVAGRGQTLADEGCVIPSAARDLWLTPIKDPSLRSG